MNDEKGSFKGKQYHRFEYQIAVEPALLGWQQLTAV